MKSCKKIVSCFLCIAILTSFLCVPASANDGIAGAAQDFFEWSVNCSQGLQNSFWKAIYGDSWMEDETGGWTGADRDELTSRYNEYVSSLKTDLGTTTLANGGVRIYMYTSYTYGGASHAYTNYNSQNNGVTNNVCWFEGYWKSNGVDLSSRYFNVYCFSREPAPFGGTYTSSVLVFDTTGLVVSSYDVKTGSTTVGDKNYSSGSVRLDFSPSISSKTQFISWRAVAYTDFYPTPNSSVPTTHDITINSRPASIVGDYGIIGDNGTIVHIEGNKIVDETGGTVYNPATGETQSYTDYAYDYSDRSYLLTLEDGNTIKVMYGDENVTIHEGDTIYNIYYLIPDDSGSGGGSDSGDTPGGEDMSWWKQAWTSFTDKLFSILGNGGSSVNPDTAPAVPDDEETGEKGYSVIDLFVVLKDGTWAFITGIVSTAYDGFTGFVESVSSAGSFFTFYDEESEDGILFVPLEGGETIWD